MENFGLGIEEAVLRAIHQCFVDNLSYSDLTLKLYYHMFLSLYWPFFNSSVVRGSYLKQEPETNGKLGIHSILEITAARRILAYWIFFDEVNESLGLSKATVEAYLLRFCDAVAAMLSEEYIRALNDDYHRCMLKTSE